MNTKHTPGPWQIEYEPNDIHNGGHIQIVVNQSGRPYKHIMQDYNGRGVETSEANAKLIAASPRVLKALQGLADYFKFMVDDITFPEYQEAIEAIKQATE